MLEQVPDEQESVVHGLPSLQFRQIPPLLPHCVVLVPTAQVPALQQRFAPTQHPPPQQAPLVQDVPSVTGVPPHCPLVQVSLFRHSDMQFTHEEPEPHAVTLAVTQLVPLQHDPAPQQLPLQQTWLLVQQVIMLQHVPLFGQPPGVQMACSAVPSSAGAVGSSIEHTESSTIAASSNAAIRKARFHESSAESSIGVSSVARSRGFRTFHSHLQPEARPKGASSGLVDEHSDRASSR
jgi:hypothetical protein